jgi:hypothetical protein
MILAWLLIWWITTWMAIHQVLSDVINRQGMQSARGPWTDIHTFTCSFFKAKRYRKSSVLHFFRYQFGHFFPLSIVRHCLVDSTRASYLGGPVFISRPRHQLSGQTFRSLHLSLHENAGPATTIKEIAICRIVKVVGCWPPLALIMAVLVTFSHLQTAHSYAYDTQRAFTFPALP